MVCANLKGRPYILNLNTWREEGKLNFTYITQYYYVTQYSAYQGMSSEKDYLAFKQD